MRKLKTRDIPGFCRCLKKLGLKEHFVAIAKDSDSLKDATDKGIELVWMLLDAATEGPGESALYEFLAGPFEMTPQQVEDLELDVFLSNMRQLAAENNLLGFFNSAAKSMR